MKTMRFLVAIAFLLSSSVVLAAKPDPNVPNPPLQVLEYNVDANGWIAVHEQGTASVDIIDTEELDVNVTGGQIDANITNSTLSVEGTVSVDNFPSEQDVYVSAGGLSVATLKYSDGFGILSGGDDIVHTFSSPIYATTIHVADTDDETYVEFFSGTSGAPVFAFWDVNGDFIEHTHSFTYPIEITGFRAACANESDSCSYVISVWGF